MELNIILILVVATFVIFFTMLLVKRNNVLKEKKHIEEERLKAKIEQDRKYLEEERMKIEKEKQAKIEEEKQRIREEQLRKQREEDEKIKQEHKSKEDESYRLLLERKKMLPQPTLKDNWLDLQKILIQNSITSLYHFTDKSNIASIKQNGGLYSWEYCDKNNIVIPRAGGSSTSRDLDMRYGLQDYVRLSFTKNHPMMFIAQKDGRIINPVILEIDIEVAYWQETAFSDMNATKTGHSQGETIEDLKRIKFHVVKRINHFDLSDSDKPYYQAEVMVKSFIPIKYIRNINQY